VLTSYYRTGIDASGDVERPPGRVGALLHPGNLDRTYGRVNPVDVPWSRARHSLPQTQLRYTGTRLRRRHHWTTQCDSSRTADTGIGQSTAVVFTVGQPGSRPRWSSPSDSDDDSDITVQDIEAETDVAVIGWGRYSDVSEPGSPSVAATLDRAAARASTAAAAAEDSRFHR